MALGIGLGLLWPSGTVLVPKQAAFSITQWLALPGKLFLAKIQMVGASIGALTSRGDGSLDR